MVLEPLRAVEQRQHGGMCVPKSTLSAAPRLPTQQVRVTMTRSHLTRLSARDDA